jgi:hypothetical protein
MLRNYPCFRFHFCEQSGEVKAVDGVIPWYSPSIKFPKYRKHGSLICVAELRNDDDFARRDFMQQVNTISGARMESKFAATSLHARMAP